MILKYGLRTLDYGLGMKYGLRYKTRTTDYGLGINHGLRYETRTVYKVRKTQTFDWV